ncbi:MAG: DUF5615 family PIN-like protein [Candidatus Verstraetearchaeota archaeon]|jgi:uncharacterized protein with PIN domain|nr:DUF5615 family PIN-like protein [Candidatus Verstraetearchaeota archaeon]
MKFIVDAMLGRLAKWLRLLGYDTIYDKTITDDELINIAKNEGRILLTRDEILFKKAIKQNINAKLINSTDFMKALKELDLHLDESIIGSRCILCNTILTTENSNIWKCPNCGKLYWQGKHWKDINKRIRFLKGDNYVDS